jgi:hypothetical protein
MTWAPSHDAPRDRPVWLFLPGGRWKSDERGRHTEIHNECVVAQWTDGKWKARDADRDVYPSMWCDADVDGPAPDMPLIEG